MPTLDGLTLGPSSTTSGDETFLSESSRNEFAFVPGVTEIEARMPSRRVKRIARQLLSSPRLYLSKWDQIERPWLGALPSGWM